MESLIKAVNTVYARLCTKQLFYVLITVAGLCALRALILPLSSDELTYYEIATNMVDTGNYHYQDKPSAISPVVPSIMYLTYTEYNPKIGIGIARLIYFGFITVGLVFLFKTLKRFSLDKDIIGAILLLTIVNNNFVIWSTTLYPESVIFCFLWIFIYGVTGDIKRLRPWFYILISVTALVMARYLFAVLGAVVVVVFIPFIKANVKKQRLKVLQLFTIIIAVLTPLLFWFYYVYEVVVYQKDTLSYFNRFENLGPLYNIKAGLGIIKHYEVDRINGIPAFASLFLPITGLRTWILSIILLLGVFIGYFHFKKTKPVLILLVVIVLIMLGYVYAGTGFSRYWLPLLPAFLLGFYLTGKTFKLIDKFFIVAAYTMSCLYVINEIRITKLILEGL